MVNSSKAKNPTPPKAGRGRIILIAVSALLAFFILAGVVLGIAVGVRNRRAVVAYDGVRMDEGVTAFFLSYYKSIFLSSLRTSGIDAYDTEDFWDDIFYSDTTYGQYYEQNAKKYISEICAAASLFDELSSLSRTDKENIDKVVAEVIEYKADGSRDRFNELAAEYGFDYSDFKEAARLLYKAQSARVGAFGKNGERLESLSDEYYDYIEEYYSLYSRVKLLFIRTETKFLLDADGNRVIGKDGNDSLVSLSDDEKAERQSILATIRAAISAAKAGADGAMNPIMFDNLLTKHGEGDADMNSSGYYFFSEADYTADFAEAFPEIVETACSMKVGEYAEVATDFGFCFIYKCDPALAAYTNTAVDGCFSDFYSDAADYIFAKSVESMRVDVLINDEGFAALNPLKIPANSSLVPKF